MCIPVILVRFNIWLILAVGTRLSCGIGLGRRQQIIRQSGLLSFQQGAMEIIAKEESGLRGEIRKICGMAVLRHKSQIVVDE